MFWCSRSGHHIVFAYCNSLPPLVCTTWRWPPWGGPKHVVVARLKSLAIKVKYSCVYDGFHIHFLHCKVYNINNSIFPGENIERLFNEAVFSHCTKCWVYIKHNTMWVDDGMINTLWPQWWWHLIIYRVTKNVIERNWDRIFGFRTWHFFNRSHVCCSGIQHDKKPSNSI
jgi:hypothetical protein